MKNRTVELMKAAKRLRKLKRACEISAADGVKLCFKEPEAGELWQMRKTLKEGDTVTVWFSNSWNRSTALQKGKVCYIHPQKRYYTVQFSNGQKSSYPWGFAE